MSRSRPLSDEEERLWRLAMRGTAPLTPSPAGQMEPLPKGRATKPKSSFTRDPFAPRASFRAPQQPQKKPAVPQLQSLDNLDRRSAQRVRRGKIEVDAKLDLHGFSQVDAHQRLIRFILSAAGHGKRVALVVTGKGKPKTSSHSWGEAPREDHFTGRGEGVLKAQVPLWLGQSPLRERIFSVQQAHQRHGGSGALYIFLRK
jgi:DNA-nicking Smr family endonuclease